MVICEWDLVLAWQWFGDKAMEGGIDLRSGHGCRKDEGEIRVPHLTLDAMVCGGDHFMIGRTWTLLYV